MSGPLSAKDRHVLVVDDDEVSSNLVASVLQWEKNSIHFAKSGEEALEILAKNDVDVVVLDIAMPGLNGYETLKKIREREKYVSVIFLSNHKKVEDIVKGLNAGADDYLGKPFHPSELLARVNAQLRMRDVRNDLMVTNTNLSKLVSTDDLTGLLNMRSLYERLDVEIERVRRFHRGLAVVMLDLDFFKRVNDTNDHLFGSFVLTEVGKLVKDNIRSVDFAARYGGDEFLIVLTDTNIVGAQVFCERLRERIGNYKFKNKNNSISITASFGFTTFDGTGTHVQGKDLVRTADRALYKSKNSGRNCVNYFATESESGAAKKA
jgi:two-component system, cell cycle response regulator